MVRLVELLIFLVMVAVPLLLFASMALVLIVALVKRRPWRFGVAVFGGYLVLIGTAAFCAYAVVPAQYTRYHQWTRLPVSSALGEQYAEAMERAESIAPRNPDEARRLRAHVMRERDDFVDDWLLLGTYGLALPLLLLLWGWRNGWYLLPRRIPPHD